MSINKLNKLLLNIESILNLDDFINKKKIIIDNFKKENPEILNKYSGIFIILERNNTKNTIERLKFMLNMATKVKDKDILEHDASS